MVDIQSPTAEIRRGKKKEEEERNRMKIYMVSLFHRVTINNKQSFSWHKTKTKSELYSNVQYTCVSSTVAHKVYKFRSFSNNAHRIARILSPHMLIISIISFA